MNEWDRNIYKRAIKTYGKKNQMIVAIEELSELQKAICKFLRNEDHNIEEEIADVKIMINQLEQMFSKGKIDEWQYLKLERLERRLNSEE